MKAFIFDMDGVIINSEPIFDELFIELGKKEDITVTIDFLNTIRGREDSEIWSLLIKEYGFSKTADYYNDTLLSQLNQHIKDSQDIAPIDGIRELIDELDKRGITMAVGSAADRNRVLLTIEKFKLGKFFKTVVSATDVPRAKPHPDIYLKVASDLNLEPADCWVLEDSANGVKAAKSAGMKCIAYKGTYNTDQDHSLADIRINSISELPLDDLQLVPLV